MAMHTNKEKLQVLSKPYLLIKDIAVLLDIGRNHAAKVKQEFLREYPNLFEGKIPTELFVKKYKQYINENRIYQYAQIEKER